MKFIHGANFKMISKKTAFIENTVKIGNNVTVYENVRIEGNTVIGDNVVIKSNCYIKDTFIGDNSIIDNSYLSGAIVERNVQVGPFARLRFGTVVKSGTRIGNFVEIKNSSIGENTKVSHLAYVGDCTLGKNCNVGCGAIFVNYNGKIKQKTEVGDNCFIGSNCNVIAPVCIKSNSYICAGTTVTDTVNSNDFVIGRVRQQVKQNRAHLYLKNMEE